MPGTDSPRMTWMTGDRRVLAGLLVFTLLVRGVVLLVMRANLQQDPDAYREIAENLLRHGEFALSRPSPDDGVSRPVPTAYRPPLYPVVLSNLSTAHGHHVSLAKVAALHLLLGVATVWLTWLTARRMLAVEGGPEGRQEIAPTVRSGLDQELKPSLRSGGPTPDDAKSGTGPPGLFRRLIGAMQTLTSRSGLFPIGPSDFPLAPLLAGLIVACDPLLLNQQTLVMTETLATFLAILSLWCLARFDTSRSCFNAAFAGGAIGLAVLCRPTFLPWLLFVGLVMVVVRGRLTFRDSALRTPRSALSPWLRDFAWRLANLAGLAVACAAVMSPWAIRNYRVFGKPIVTTTHGGYTLLLGNNVSFYDWLEHDSSGLPWSAAKISGDAPYILGNLNLVLGMDLSSTVVVPQSEQALDAMNYRIAGRIIRQHPAIFTRACLYRLRQLWSPLPHKLTTDESTGRRLLRYATCTWYCSVYVLAVIGIWRLRWKLLTPPWIWGVLLCVAFTAVHTFYWTNLRMRAPLMPFVAIVAAGAVSSSKFNVPGSKLLNPEP